MECQTELLYADLCVHEEEACTACFEPSSFLDVFPGRAEDYFRETMSYSSRFSPDFCVEANWRVCKKYYAPENGPYSCCCLAETKAYNKCMFPTWLIKYYVADIDCEYDGCEMFALEETIHEEEGGNQPFIIGVSVGGSVLVSLFVLYLCWRRWHLHSQTRDATIIDAKCHWATRADDNRHRRDGFRCLLPDEVLLERSRDPIERFSESGYNTDITSEQLSVTEHATDITSERYSESGYTTDNTTDNIREEYIDEIISDTASERFSEADHTIGNTSENTRD